MRVGIFVEVVKAEFHTGISRYVKRLVETLVSHHSEDTNFYLYYQKQSGEKPLDWLQDLPQVKHRPLWTPVNLLSEHPSVWWKYYLPLMLKWDRIDLFHGPNHYIPLKGNVPTVLTIHDIAYFFMTVHGEGMDAMMKRLTLQNMAAATSIVAVSESTAKDIIGQGADAEKVSVIYQGFEPNPKQPVTTELVNGVSIPTMSPYLLFISTLQPRKNVVYIVDEFARVCEQIPHHLVLAGAPGDSQSEVEAKIKTYGLEDRVHLTGFISDEERHALYSNADVFLYPSLYEGFGLVVLEAMSYDLPVITGNNSSLPEAAGDAGLTIDITQSEALSQAILDVLEKPGLRESMVSKGAAHCRAFGWDESARQMMALYKKVVNDNNKKR